MFKKDMTNIELATLSQKEGINIDDLLTHYKDWKIQTGLIKVSSLTPTKQLEAKLGSVNPSEEALMLVINKALPLLDKVDTLKLGSEIIVKAYDSLKGNKSKGTEVNLTTQVHSHISVEQLKEERKQLIEGIKNGKL